MKTIFFSILVGLLAGSPLFADQHGKFIDSRAMLDGPLTYASRIMNKDVYVANTEDVPKYVAEEPVQWQNIGNVNDIVISRDGKMKAALIDVGGFLGIGARTIAVDMQALNIVERQDAKGFFLVIAATRAELENAPEFQDETGRNDQSDDRQYSEDYTGGRGQPRIDAQQRETTDSQNDRNIQDRIKANQDSSLEKSEVGDDADSSPNALLRYDVDVETPLDPARPHRIIDVEPAEGFERVSPGLISGAELQDADVYDSDSVKVASVSEVMITSEGQIERLVVEFGGVLGIGTRSVAIDIENVDIHRAENEFRVYIPMSGTELRTAPEYQSN